METRFEHCIDYWSGVFSLSSVRFVCDYLHVSDLFAGFLTLPTFKTASFIYGDIIHFSFDGVRIELPRVEFEKARRACSNEATGEITGDWSSYEFTRIRVTLSGSTLLKLRCMQIDIDSVLRQECARLKVTRVDFAFDFVNNDFDLLESLCKFVSSKDHLTPRGRISITGHRSGIGYTRRNGSSERTFYLGTPQSDRLVRIYDKKLERTVAGHGHFDEVHFGLPPSDIQTWIRVEWQLRNDYAQQILMQTTPDDYGYRQILQYMYEFYELCYYKTGGRFGVWEKFFNPGRIASLIVHKPNLV